MEIDHRGDQSKNSTIDVDFDGFLFFQGAIPIRTDLQPLAIMIDDADIAEW